MIVFEKIRFKNFLSTGNAFNEIDYTKTPTTLVVGKNGSGKTSTTLDCICYALYNKAFRKVNKPQLLNNVNNKQLLVELEFSIGKTKYLVKRGMKPNVFEIYQNSKLINVSADSRDYQEILEKQILKLNYKSFCQIVIQGASGSLPFMLLSAQNRREVVEDLLDLQVFSIMNSLLKQRISDNNSRFTELEYELRLVDEKITLNQQHSETLKDNIQEEIKRLSEEIADNNKTIEKLRSEIEGYNLSIKQYQFDISDKSKVLERKKKLEELQVQFRSKIKELKCNHSFYSDHDNCPTCKQNIDSDFKSTVLDKTEKEQEKLEDAFGELVLKLNELSERQEQINKITSKISDINLEVFRCQNTISSLIEYNDKLNIKIKGLEEKHTEYSTEQVLKNLYDEKDSIEKQYKKCQDMKETYSLSSHILKDSGIKSKIIKQYIPVINKLINKYLTEMEFYIEFHFDENFNETIKTRNRDGLTYPSLSEGERSRVNMAILLTWRALTRMRNGASSNLLILDEVLDGSLDAQGLDCLINIIQREGKNTNTFLISHKVDQISDKFDRVLEFKKHNNFTIVKEF